MPPNNRRRMALTALFGLSAVLTAVAACAAPEPPVGFIWHYPFVDVGTPLVPHAGVSTMMARAAWRAIEPEPGRFDFGTVDRQIARAEEGGYRLVLLLEVNAFCAPEWVVRQVEAAGDGVRDPAGGATGQGPHGGLPRAHSALFTRLQDRVLRALTDHVRATDRRRVITHYQPGIEWWFPHSARYAAADVARFRGWLRARYGRINRLNAAWGTACAGFDEVDAPRFDVPDLFAARPDGSHPQYVGGSPPHGGGRAAVQDWSRFWTQTAAEVIDDLARRVRALDGTRRIASFMTLAFATPAEWDYAQWAAVRIDAVGRSARHIDDLGMQLCVASGDTHRITAGLDVARKYGKPLWVMDLLDFTLGTDVPRVSMRRATHAAVQHGATGLFYCCWNGAKDFDFHPVWPIEDLRAMLAEARAAIRAVSGTRPAPEAALVLPILPVAPDDRGGEPNRPGSFIGWYRLLEDLRVPVDVLTLEDLEHGHPALSRYRWVLVPDCPRLSPGAANRLAAYARRGGRVVLGGRFGEADPAGRPLRQAAPPRAARWPDDGLAYAGSLTRRSQAGDTPPLIQRGPDTPARAAVRRRVAARLAAFLRSQRARPGVEVTGAPHGVTLGVLKGSGRQVVYLVNRADAPARGITLRLRGAAGARIAVLADMRPVARSAAHGPPGGVATVKLPPFRVSCLVSVEPARRAARQSL